MFELKREVFEQKSPKFKKSFLITAKSLKLGGLGNKIGTVSEMGIFLLPLLVVFSVFQTSLGSLSLCLL